VTAPGPRNAAIVWFRRDLRVSDNPALSAAVAGGGPVIPVFVLSPEEEGKPPPGSASRAWLSRSLSALDGTLRSLGSRLVVRRGPSLRELLAVAARADAAAVHWNRLYEPSAGDRDDKVERGLAERGIRPESFPGSLLFEPGDVRSSGKGPFRVFTPFWRRCLSLSDPPAPNRTPRKLSPPPAWPDSLDLPDLPLPDPARDSSRNILREWEPGEKGAGASLSRFLDEALADYPENRDRPDLPGTSRLSPHLHFGEISPGQVWRAVTARAAVDPERGVARGAEAFLRQIGWREFAHHLLHHFPRTPEEPLREEFSRFPWRQDEKGLDAWKRGQTGYPIVDAGMRELQATGWMHNRVRMIVASFLVKDLLIPWQKGAAWFLETLVDADLANNTLGWQWVAGCGADAAPYFRIFNPVTQGERYDPEGGYVRKWVPEIAGIPAAWIHRPWEAPTGVLREAGVRPDRTYPKPVVDHRAARERALGALASMRKTGR